MNFSSSWQNKKIFLRTCTCRRYRPSILPPVRFPQNRVIVRQGDSATAFYFIIFGTGRCPEDFPRSSLLGRCFVEINVSFACENAANDSFASDLIPLSKAVFILVLIHGSDFLNVLYMCVSHGQLPGIAGCGTTGRSCARLFYGPLRNRWDVFSWCLVASKQLMSFCQLQTLKFVSWGSDKQRVHKLHSQYLHNFT